MARSAIRETLAQRALPRIALKEGIRVRRLLPSDESLESVFSYLVEA